MARNKHIMVRLNEQEYEKISSEAKKRNSSVAQYIRELIQVESVVQNMSVQSLNEYLKEVQERLKYNEVRIKTLASEQASTLANVEQMNNKIKAAVVQLPDLSVMQEELNIKGEAGEIFKAMAEAVVRLKKIGDEVHEQMDVKKASKEKVF